MSKNHDSSSVDNSSPKSQNGTKNQSSLLCPWENMTLEKASIPTVVVNEEDQQAQKGGKIDFHSDESGGPAVLALDSVERELFEILSRTAEKYNNQIADPVAERDRLLEIRVAGGWVRDKLMGLSTHDVDIAVNHLTGVQFATLVHEFVGGRSDCGRMGVIAANPAQSKHLETACMRVCGIPVDFCNLRSEEVYEHDSRIPQTEIGTPAEDAYRRDFTMNALFYNLHTQKIEDWTTRGFSDLKRGELVTPLPALQTFRDDPLRVLRAIRFAVRYDHFTLHPDIEQAAMNLEIHKLLHIKVSRERVGKELDGMLSGKSDGSTKGKPIAALRVISKLKLAGSVLSLPRQEGIITKMWGPIAGQEYSFPDDDAPEARHLRELGWDESIKLLDVFEPLFHQFESAAANALTLSLTSTQIDTRLLPIALFLLPFRFLQYEERKKPGKPCLAVSWVIREGLKFKNKDVQSMTTLFETLDEMVQLLQRALAATRLTSSLPTDDSVNPSLTCCRLQAGLLLRSTKDLWLTSLILATVVKIEESKQQQEQAGAVEYWTNISLQLYHSILSQNLDGCWKVRPLLDGKAVIAALDLPKGPEIGTYLDEQMKWMLLNPNGTPDECKAHLQSVKRSRSRLSLNSTPPGGVSGSDTAIDQTTVSSSAELNESHLGMSDGTGTVATGGMCGSGAPIAEEKSDRHFSKKMHVESMDISVDGN